VSLRVGLDGGALYRPESGIGRYTLELIRGLAALDADLDLRVLANRFRAGGVLPPLGPAVRTVNPRIPDRILKAGWKLLARPTVEALLGDLDVFHMSDWSHPPLRRARMVATVHDLGPVEHPEWYAPQVVRHFRAVHRSVADRADAVIAVSAATREAFIRCMGAAPGRVHVVHSGISADFAPVPSDAAWEVADTYGLQGPFVLYVGSRERRKNLVGLVHAYARVAERRPDVSLVLVGARPQVEARRVQGAQAWSGTEIEDAIASSGIADKVRILGMVPRSHLPALYSAASLFAFPTLYEGFGFPGLEAIACGTPVVATDRSAVPEVLGDAAVLADPTDPGAFGGAMLRILDDDGLVAELRTKGLERARMFTWERTARETLEVYRRVASPLEESGDVS